MRAVFVTCLALCVSACVYDGDSLKFKFQTSGQGIDNVPIIERTIRGDILKPPSPTDAKIFRDAQFNALIQWRRRGRINYHWRDRAGVPVSEETEYYEIEVLDGSTVVRTVRIPVNEAQPIQWVVSSGPASELTFASDGSGTVFRNTLTNFVFQNVLSKQQIDGDFVLLFETYHDGDVIYNLPGFLLIEPVGVGTSIGGFFTSGSFIGQVTFLESTTAIAGDQFAIERIDGTTKYYKNPTSDNSPILGSLAPPDVNAPYRIRLVFDHNNKNGIRNPMLLRFTTPDWTYTADMQTADGLTPGDPIHLKIYMVSATVGRGRPLEVTL